MLNWDKHIGKQYIFMGNYAYHQKGKMLVRDVRRQDGELLRQHLFIPYTKRFRIKCLNRGDTLVIRAKVNRYFKKHPDHRDKRRHPKYLIAKYELTNIHIIKIERQ